MVEDSPPEAYLVVITETGQREVHRVERSSMILGRGADSDLVLTNPRVSRRHAQLAWDGEHFLVQDLGSKNGTHINSAPVSTPTPIADGDTLELADSRLEFQTSPPTVTIVLTPGSGALSLDPSTHEVRVQSQSVALTPKEYRLLALLFRRAGAVTDDSIAQVVARLRRKVEANPANPRYVLTVRGFGYRLDRGEQEKD
jgi:hypothetical protein